MDIPRPLWYIDSGNIRRCSLIHLQLFCGFFSTGAIMTMHTWHTKGCVSFWSRTWHNCRTLGFSSNKISSFTLSLRDTPVSVKWNHCRYSWCASQPAIWTCYTELLVYTVFYLINHCILYCAPWFVFEAWDMGLSNFQIACFKWVLSDFLIKPILQFRIVILYRTVLIRERMGLVYFDYSLPMKWFCTCNLSLKHL